MAPRISDELADLSPDLEIEPASAPRPEHNDDGAKRTFLLFATEWLSGHGGLSTINRGMAVELAAAGHRVLCFAPSAGDLEVQLAKSLKVEILRNRSPGMSFEERLGFGPDLAPGTEVDYVVGHGHVTGPVAAAWAQRLNVSYLHVVHTTPDEIASAKISGGDPTIFNRAEEKSRVELSLCLASHLVIAVGPFLYDDVVTRIQDAVAAYQLNPGLTVELLSQRPDVKLRRQEKCLFVGRGNDPEVKGLDLLASALRSLRGKANANGSKLPFVIFRGLADVESVKGLFGNVQGLHFHPFSSEPNVVWQDLNSASLLLMPSRAEGFGLVALEAISAGVPILVSERSGIAQLLKSFADDKVIPQECYDCAVVPMSGDDEADANVWGDRIAESMRDRSAAFARASRLRSAVEAVLTWRAAIAGMLLQLSSMDRRGRVKGL